MMMIFVGFCYKSSPPARIAGADRIWGRMAKKAAVVVVLLLLVPLTGSIECYVDVG